MPFVAVDIGDRALAAGGRGEAGIVGEDAGLGVELADVDDVGPDRAVQHREVDALAAERRAWPLVRHVCSCSVHPVARSGRGFRSRPSRASTSKIPGEVARPVSAARSGCASLPSFTPSALGNLPHRLLSRLGGPVVEPDKRLVDAGRASARASPASAAAAAFSSSVERARCEQERRAFGQLVEVLGARLQLRHRLGEQRRLLGIESRPSAPRSVARQGRRAGASSASRI